MATTRYRYQGVYLKGVYLLKGCTFKGVHQAYPPLRRKEPRTRYTHPSPGKGPGTRHALPCGQTHACVNITFPQLRWHAVKMCFLFSADPDICERVTCPEYVSYFTSWTDCSRYYACVGRQITAELVCNGGRHFNEQNYTCQKPDVADCPVGMFKNVTENFSRWLSILGRNSLL